MNSYCIQDPKIELYGALSQLRGENVSKKVEHSYVTVDFTKCTDENRNKTLMVGCTGDDCEHDPPCADQIDDWLQNKKISGVFLNNKANFAKNDPNDITSLEKVIPSMPMSQYTDAGFRYRKNSFTIIKSWLPYAETINK